MKIFDYLLIIGCIASLVACNFFAEASWQRDLFRFISVNSDPDAPINKIADYVIVGTVEEVVPKLIKYYKQNSK